jgi:hypothetical protein
VVRPVPGDVIGMAHADDAPLVFFLLIGLGLVTVLVDLEARRLDAKTVALQTLDNLEPHLDTLKTMERASEVHRQVEFEYRPLERPEPVRHRYEVEEIALREGHIYLSGYEPDLRQWLELRLDRVIPGSARLLPGKDERAGVSPHPETGADDCRSFPPVRTSSGR